MQIYIELKIRQDKVNQSIIQLNYNIANNKDIDKVLVELTSRQQDLKDFKKENHLF